MNAFEALKAGLLAVASKKRKEGEEPSKINKHKKYELEKRERYFPEKWRQGRPWLVYDKESNIMTCTWCKENNVESNFVKGTSNLKFETIKQHEGTKWHVYYTPRYSKSNVDKEDHTSAMNCLKHLLQHDQERLRSKFRTAHAIAKHGKSYKDFEFICTLDRVKGLDVGETYCSYKAAKSFISSIAHTQRSALIERINTTKFYSFSCDGTTDFTGEDLECFYIRICIDGVVQDIFLHIGSPESSSSEDIFNYITQLFLDYKIDINKLVGFTADGASNMHGLKSGLAARLLKGASHIVITHCVAHRLELAFKDAIKTSTKTLFDKAMTLLLGLYYLYKKSPKMKKALKRSFAALNQKPNLPVRVGGTRWLPHVNKALDIFFRNYSVFRHQLEDASHKNPKAEGLAKLMKDGNLIVFLLLLKEVIFHLMKLSLYLQRDGLVLADAYVHVESTKSVLFQLDKKTVSEAEKSVETKIYVGQPLVFRNTCNPSDILTKLTISTSDAMATRFKENEIVEATSVASFANWPLPSSDSIADYGDKEVELLMTRFHQVLDDAGVKVEQCLSEWTSLKTKVYKKFSMELRKHQLTWESVYHAFNDLRNILTLFDLVLSLPATSVKNECLFSTMKLTKGKRRGRLANAALNDLLLIAVESPSVPNFDPDDAILNWMKTPGSRRLHYLRKKKVTSTTTSSSTTSENEVVRENNNGLETNLDNVEGQDISMISVE